MEQERLKECIMCHARFAVSDLMEGKDNGCYCVPDLDSGFLMDVKEEKK